MGTRIPYVAYGRSIKECAGFRGMDRTGTDYAEYAKSKKEISEARQETGNTAVLGLAIILQKWNEARTVTGNTLSGNTEQSESTSAQTERSIRQETHSNVLYNRRSPERHDLTLRFKSTTCLDCLCDWCATRNIAGNGRVWLIHRVGLRLCKQRCTVREQTNCFYKAWINDAENCKNHEQWEIHHERPVLRLRNTFLKQYTREQVVVMHLHFPLDLPMFWQWSKYVY